MEIDREWHRNQINRYKQEYDSYVKYAQIIKDILDKACSIYAPEAIVKVRAKTIYGFAEKAIRKFEKYKNPVEQITDLCGARVITQTPAEAETFCRFIENNFIIDWENSLDVSGRLDKNEFGYRAIHYVITLPQDPVLGVLAKDIGERKAEIQVRTLLQHAWSEITHQRIYKCSFEIPAQLQRDSARLAALMESSDALFEEFAGSIDRYRFNYSSYTNIDDVFREIDVIKTTLANYPDPSGPERPRLALRMARAARIVKRWDDIVEILQPLSVLKEIDPYHESQLSLELGYSLCRKHAERPQDCAYREGLDLLKSIACPDPPRTWIAHEERLLQTEALSRLAWSYKNMGELDTARKFYLKAYEQNPQNPYYLADCIEQFAENTEHLTLLKTKIMEAIHICHEHVEAGLEMPQAFFAIGRFHQVLREYVASGKAYMNGVYFCRCLKESRREDAFSSSFIDLITGELDYLNRVSDEQTGFTQIRNLLLLGEHVLSGSGGAGSPDGFRNTIPVLPDYTKPAVILAGEKTDDHLLLIKSLRDFIGSVIISGSSSADLAGRLERAGITVYRSTPAECWPGILLAGVDPAEVACLGLDSGETAALECRLSLALGARVGLLERGGAAAEFLGEKLYKGDKNLVLLPRDPAVIKIFLNRRPVPVRLSPEQVEKAAKAVHRSYLASTRPEDASHQPWEELQSQFKESNRSHVLFIEENLGVCRYGIQGAAKPKKAVFSEEEIEIMAEMEHGRFVLERLTEGWRFGPVKDPDLKISPSLVSWEALDETYREIDRELVRRYPEILNSVGLEIYKLL